MKEESKENESVISCTFIEGGSDHDIAAALKG